MINMSPELAEICGIHAGDGYLRKRKTRKIELDITGHSEEKDYYDNHVVALFNKYFNLNLKAKLYIKGSYGFVITNEQFKIFNQLGFPYGKKSSIVKVPKKILNSKNKVFYANFLRGLFDTDGNLYFKNRKTMKNYSEFKKRYNYYPTINIKTISKKLIENVSIMLNYIGIKHFISSYQSKKEHEKKCYILYINGVNRLVQWMNIIGVKNPVKLTRYLIWKKFGFCPPHTSLQQRKDILKGKLNIYSIGL